MLRSGGSKCVMLMAVSVISGCGGGGGGGGGSPGLTGPAYLPPGTNTSFRALSATEEFSAYSITGGGENNAPPSPAILQSVELGNATTTRITFRPTSSMENYQVIVRVTGAPDGVTLDRTFTVNSSTSVVQNWPETDVRLTAFPSTTNPTSALVHNDLTSTRTPQLNYQAFGYWLNDPTPTRSDAGFFSVGIVTQSASIPGSGTATYTGSLIGGAGAFINSINAVTYTLNTRVAATVDFGNSSMVFSTTDARRTFDGTTWVLDGRFNVTGTLNWTPGTNSFSGSVTNATLTSGNASGRFYGPNAQELGGVLSAVSADGNTAMTGSFGAVRGPITP